MIEQTFSQKLIELENHLNKIDVEVKRLKIPSGFKQWNYCSQFSTKCKYRIRHQARSRSKTAKNKIYSLCLNTREYCSLKQKDPVILSKKDVTI